MTCFPLPFSSQASSQPMFYTPIHNAQGVSQKTFVQEMYQNLYDNIVRNIEFIASSRDENSLNVQRYMSIISKVSYRYEQGRLLHFIQKGMQPCVMNRPHDVESSLHISFRIWFAPVCVSDPYICMHICAATFCGLKNAHHVSKCECYLYGMCTWDPILKFHCRMNGKPTV